MSKLASWCSRVALAAAVAGCASGAATRAVRLYERGDYRAAAQAAEQGRRASVGDEDAWRMQLRALLALGEREALVETYAAYRQARGGADDAALLLELAEATLGQGLRAPSVALRVASIRAVEKAELRGLADAVAQRLADPDDRVVAAAAAAVLRGYADAAEALDDMLRSEDEEARRLALDGLGRKVAKHAVQELRAGAQDRSPVVRETALRHLGELRQDELAPVLLAHAADRAAPVRAAALRALAQLPGVASLGAARALASSASRDEALSVRMAALELLLALGEAPALERLVGDGEVSVALAAARALRLDAQRSAPVLERGLTSAAWTDRVAALGQLVALLGEAGAARARPLLADPAPEVRLAAARVVARRGGLAEALAVIEALVAPLSAAGASASGAAVDAAVDLMALEERRGEEVLAAALRVRSAERRSQAVAGHRLVGRVTPGLLGALADASPAVRVEAAAVMAELARKLE